MIVESYEDVIILSGALRANHWETIHTAISLTLKRHATGVIVDCSGIVECTEAGAETFRDAMEYIAEHDARIIVAAVPKAVMDVLKTVPEVRSQLPIANSVEEARRSLDLLEEQPTKRKTNLAPCRCKILVCLTGHTTDSDALHMAWHLADTQHAEVHLTFVVSVPRHLPLQSPLPDAEEVARKSLEAGKVFLSERQLQAVGHLERARDLASGLATALQGIDAMQVVVPLPNGDSTVAASSNLVSAVLAKVTLPVIFVKGFPTVAYEEVGGKRRGA